MKKLFLVGLTCALVLGGCASGGTMLADPSKMSAEQIAAMAKLKEANVWCVVINSPYGKGSSVAINTDKGVAGNIRVGDSCAIEMTGPAPKPAPVQ